MSNAITFRATSDHYLADDWFPEKMRQKYHWFPPKAEVISQELATPN